MPAIVRPTLTKLAENGTRDGSSQTSTLGLGEVNVKRKLVVLWEEANKAAQHFLGFSRISRDGMGLPIRIERLLPISHPDDPALIATALSVTTNHHWLSSRGTNIALPGSRTNRLPDQSVGSIYDKLMFDVQYERPMYTLLEDSAVLPSEEYMRYVDFLEPKPSTEVITLPGYSLNYTLAVGQPKPAIFLDRTKAAIPGNVPLIQPIRDVYAVWKRLPADFYSFFSTSPWLDRITGTPNATTPIKPYIGTVNKTQFGSYPAGTLLFTNWEPIRKPAPFVLYTGSPGSMTWISPAVEWDIKFTFRYKPNGHNYIYLNDMAIPPPAVSPPPPPPPPAVPPPPPPPLVPPPPPTLRSGYYYVSRTGVFNTSGNVPDGDSIFNEREFRDLFKVSI